ncbi:hypothetical protein SAMN02745215_03768 [Desulfitobacterium chlororespirans DSM 11544]|uniref:Uncharacterized protein n=1 Tax=Desulfitobacterium chlororespirans DSM 11544 TaxID=1121395 RepID=A0A1M7UGR5_9FIRM|nr:hypothetical protein SAMN02745215_03768 [Desulfitobacterium chlororespirans DSM 11544]
MRGEQKISLYWITVILVSAPFILIMTRMAYRFNLKKWEAALVSFLMITFALVFPTVLRCEKVLHWLLGVCGLLLFTVGITAIRNRSQPPPESSIAVDEPKEEDDVFCPDEAAISHQEEAAISYQEEDTVSLPSEDGPSDPVEEKRADTPEVLLPEHEQEAAEEAVKEEAGDAEPMEILDEDESVETEANLCEEANLLEEVTKLEEIRPEEKSINDEILSASEPVEETEPPLIHMKEFSLQELIEKGFQAKEQERFHLAAEWFMLALDQKPSYDIAFYLIVETCGHWKNGSSIYDALDKVTPYINEYIQNAPPEWRTQLLEWLDNENLPVPGEFRKD